MSQPTIIQKISQKVIQSKKSAYSEQPIITAMSYMDDYQVADSSVYNKYNQKLKVSLFFNRKTKHQKCVVYMHGYGSNRLQAVCLLKYLPEDISLCCFDFSGEGKSQGKIVTFGIKQKDDIRAILGYLRTCGYKQFILWGRSMGATCTLLFSIKQKPVDVCLQILDSPFISFTQAAMQLTKKRLNIPQILLKFALQTLSQNLASTQQYNPFQIDLNKPIYCSIPTIFVYSQNDQVINSNNSQKIINNFKGYYQKIIITQSHNAMRNNNTMVNLVSVIKKYLLCKVQHSQQNRKSLPYYINKQANQKYQNKNKLTKRNSFDSHGIWVSTKFIKDQNKEEICKQHINKKLSMSQIQDRTFKSSIKVISRENSQKKLALTAGKNYTELKQIPKIHRLSHSKQKRSYGQQLFF